MRKRTNRRTRVRAAAAGANTNNPSSLPRSLRYRTGGVRRAFSWFSRLHLRVYQVRHQQQDQERKHFLEALSGEINILNAKHNRVTNALSDRVTKCVHVLYANGFVLTLAPVLRSTGKSLSCRERACKP